MKDKREHENGFFKSGKKIGRPTRPDRDTVVRTSIIIGKKVWKSLQREKLRRECTAETILTEALALYFRERKDIKAAATAERL